MQLVLLSLLFCSVCCFARFVVLLSLLFCSSFVSISLTNIFGQLCKTESLCAQNFPTPRDGGSAQDDGTMGGKMAV